MGKWAYILLNLPSQSAATATYSVDLDGTGAPTSLATDLEKLIGMGYVARREVALSNGAVLLVMEGPSPAQLPTVGGVLRGISGLFTRA